MSFLVPELLDLMLGRPDSSYLVLRLWKCGNRHLQQMLAQGLTYLQLSHVKGMNSEYPRLLSSLKNLRHLSLKAEGKMMKIHMAWKVELPKLSNKLEVLEIQCQDAMFALLDFAPGSSGKEIELLQTDRYGRGESHLIDVGRLFPRLHTLKVLNLKNVLTLMPHDFAGLPNTLTHISCGRIQKDATDYEFMALLPRSLRTLDADVIVNLDPPNILEPATELLNDWKRAPPHLEHIRVLAIMHTDTTAWMPRSLTSCDIVWIESYQCYTLSSVRTLPPQLRNLNLRKLVSDTFTSEGTDWYRELPKNLTELNLGSDIRECIASLPHLPKTLLKLAMGRKIAWAELKSAIGMAQANADGKTNIWPPALEHLVISADTINSDQASMLSPTLNTLDLQIDNSLFQDDEQEMDHNAVLDAAVLPSSLRSLKINRCNASISGTMPSGLKSLTLQFDEEVFGIATATLDALPSSLTHLHLEELKISDLQQPLRKLPTGLLVLHTDRYVTRDFTFVPRTVTDLDLGHIDFTTRPTDGDIFAGLPLGLRKLKLRGNIYKTSIFDGALPTLRAMCNLAELRVQRPVIVTQIFKYLPSSLTTLIIYGEKFSNENIQYLPPHLTDLAPIEPFEWDSPEIAQLWPPNLIDLIPANHQSIRAAVDKRRQSLYH